MNQTASFVVTLFLVGSFIVAIFAIYIDAAEHHEADEAFARGYAQCQAEQADRIDSVAFELWLDDWLDAYWAEPTAVRIIFSATSGPSGFIVLDTIDAKAGRWLDPSFYRPDPNRIPKP